MVIIDVILNYFWSSQSSVKVKNDGAAVPPLFHTLASHDAYFIKHKDNCCFVFN
jgi:hypothetical protein